MGKKKPFVDRKRSSTYHLVHRSQRDVAGDILYDQEGIDLSSESMILWPSPGNRPETNQAVLAPPVVLKNESSSNTTTTTTTTTNATSTMAAWKERLQAAGLLFEDPKLKPISGTGVFLDATGSSRTATTNSKRETAATAVFEQEDLLLEVDRQFESLPLTADCMDEDIAAALFADDFNADDYEELNDDFVLDAAQEPEETDDSKEAFDFDAHVRMLMEKARQERLGTGIDGTHAWGNKDQEFFSNLNPLHEEDEDSWEQEFGATDGVVPALSPEEERALCEKFAETLAEYDSDECGDCPEEEIAGPRPLEGDAQLEAALDEFMMEREDDIFIQGSRQYLNNAKQGGSGFSALVNGRMVHASRFNELNPAEDGEEPETADQVLASARERLAQPHLKPPMEDILIDGKSYFSERERNPYDCESILSTYSNLDNNPVTIEASRRRKKKKNANLSISPDEEGDKRVQPIQLSAKTGLPLGVLPSRPVHDDHFDDTIASVNRGVARNKEETLEEKKARKEQIKKEKMLARIQKKAMKEVFKEEFQKRAIDLGSDEVAGKTVYRFS